VKPISYLVLDQTPEVANNERGMPNDELASTLALQMFDCKT